MHLASQNIPVENARYTKLFLSVYLSSMFGLEFAEITFFSLS